MRAKWVMGFWCAAVSPFLLIGAAFAEDAPALSQPSPHPNVVIVTIDTCRADHIGCYGYRAGNTPAIDALASEGVRCANAATAVPVTVPSHSTILTGLYPAAHGVRDNGEYILSDKALTLAERLKKQGYATGAFVSAVVLSRIYNLSQGFDIYDDDLWEEDRSPMFMITKREASKTAQRAIAWLEERTAQDPATPFFLWVHFFDPHQPYKSSLLHKDKSWLSNRLLSPMPYDAEITNADSGVGMLVNWLKEKDLFDNTLFLLTADHGEGLGEHEEKTHAIFIYDTTIHIPMIWRFPKVLPRGVVYNDAVRTVDIVPTVIGLLGLPRARDTQGTDLHGAFSGREPPPKLPQYFESLVPQLGFGMAPLYGVAVDGLKYIRAPKPELYERGSDPHELNNVYEDRRADAEALSGRLDDILRACADRQLEVTKNTLGRENMEQLQALGYLAQGGAPAKSLDGIDPKDGIILYEELDAARNLAREGKWADCEANARELLDQVPDNLSALNLRSLALMKLNRLDEAIEVCARSLALDPSQHRIVFFEGNIECMRGNLDAAEKFYKKSLELAPRFTDAMVRMAFLCRQRDDMPGAETWCARALAEDPHSPEVHTSYADLFYAKDDYAAALGYYKKALEVKPKDFAVLCLAGECAQRTGDFAGSEVYTNRAAALRPDSWIPPYNLACLRVAQKKNDDAIVLIKKALAAQSGNDELARLLAEDADLKPLRESTAFKEVVMMAKQQTVRGDTEGAAPHGGP